MQYVQYMGNPFLNVGNQSKIFSRYCSMRDSRVANHVRGLIETRDRELREAEWNDVKGILDNSSALQGYTGPWKIKANEMNVCDNVVPSERSISRSVGLQSCALDCAMNAPFTQMIVWENLHTPYFLYI